MQLAVSRREGSTEGRLDLSCQDWISEPTSRGRHGWRRRRFMIEFLFPRRLHRLAYLLRGLTANFVTYVLCSNITSHSGLWWTSIVAIWVYEAFFIVLPRIRDIGMNSWWVLAALVPIVNGVFGIILLFRAPVRLSKESNQVPQPAVAPVRS